ncbi:terminase TerL endonuclease subunit [Staphylococcus pseudintermedius]|uniref:terminase TerL endonuclease subunit n=1 Tax=Staphylococcus pseudintermedius TaxID=283734 RepID=UPI0019E8B997|nr:terminase TerL endonuclease subunit [Staphylococcus pseudintermedius]EGQ3041186.1 terminase large subunit [Staphylococcus pseudintermedius]EGQ3383018.1 terminase large subunit [Staphylococcus pseudintermedius]EGQ3850704.1 terminase large subunit [Staphylococcus pseudintermedius]EGQ4034839.1 terminase large subunit [Staphylococcus pseudintermedius]EGQ4470355.1 terminase large subunit [Staphylococcus pseudintermedius]
MKTPKYVTQYIDKIKTGKIIVNKERQNLVDYLEKYILNRDDLYFDFQKIEDYVGFSEKWFFEIQDFQKFITCFVFLYEADTLTPYFSEFFISMARGGGKNGYISTLGAFFLTPLHGIPKYNMSVVANSEKQAQVSFQEIYDMIESNDLYVRKDKPNNPFNISKVLIEGISMKAQFVFDTSNEKTKDGAREGCVFFDEIHAYEKDTIINVKRSGLGKVAHPRTFYIGTDGHVREGFLDKLKERAANVLIGESPEDRLFPFICKIDDKEELHDFDMWQKANPMFEAPMNDYGRQLFQEVKQQYLSLKFNPSGRTEFMTKRMNLPETDSQSVVAPWDDILATNRDMPLLDNHECIGGLDYASLKDFAAVGLLFKVDDEYIWKTHSFARKAFLDEYQLKPPIHEWAEKGLLTIVDEPTISPKHIIDWFLEAQKHYGLKKVIADNFRMDLLRPLFEENDIDYEVVKNTRAIQSLLAPRVEDMFAQQNIIFGDNPLMRWYTGNVAVKIDKYGNKTYEKKEPVRRKTDGFQALIHALYRADDLNGASLDAEIDLLRGLRF